MKLSPAQQKVIDYLSDGEWHCMASRDWYMKDDRSRIAELNGKGYVIDAMPCDRSCGVNHSSRIVMRRLVATPPLNEYQKYHEQIQAL